MVGVTNEFQHREETDRSTPGNVLAACSTAPDKKKTFEQRRAFKLLNMPSFFSSLFFLFFSFFSS